MNKQISYKIVSLVFGILVVCFVVGFYVFAVWTEPTETPPGGNAPAPLNVSNVGQTKIGGLALNTGPDGIISADGAANGLLIYEGNVGIGTTNPGQKLHIQDSDNDDFVMRVDKAATGRASLIEFQNSVDTLTGYVGLTANTGGIMVQGSDASGIDSLFRIQTNEGVERFRVTADGNVGIGTTSPISKIDIRDDVTSTGSGLTQDVLFRVAGIADGQYRPDSGRVWIEYGPQAAPLLVLEDGDNPPRIQFQQVGNTGTEDNPNYYSWIGQAGMLSSDIAIMNGRVGIGTMSPQSTLQVTGNYIQFPTSWSNPPANDCDQALEYGRVIVILGSTNKLAVCTNTGWQYIAD